MQQSEKKLTLKQLKKYSRKQVVSWVNSSSIYKYQDLNNGTFFLQILQKIVPSDINRSKVYYKANNLYQSTHNVNLVKRILSRHGLQTNMDVTTVVNTKNCFQLANWFKNLYEQNKDENDTSFVFTEKNFTPSKFNGTINSFKSPSVKSISRAISSDIKRNPNVWNNIAEKKLEVMNNTQRPTNIKKIPSKFLATQNIAANLNSQLSKSGLSRKKSESIIKKRTQKSKGRKIEKQSRYSVSSIFQDKSEVADQSFNDLTSLNLSSLKMKKQKYWPSSKKVPTKLQKTEPEEEQFQQTPLVNLMKKQALQDSIQSYSEILGRIKNYLELQVTSHNIKNEGLNMQIMKQQVLDRIYLRIK